jgi:hypothetical protein
MKPPTPTDSTSEPIGDEDQSRLALKRAVAGLGKDGKNSNNVAGRGPPSKGEKSRQAEGYEGAEEAEESRDIRGRRRDGECAGTCVASWRTQSDFRKARKTSVRIAGVKAGILSEHLGNISLKYYRYAKLLDRMINKLDMVAVVTSFEVITRHLPGRAEENHRKRRIRQSVARPGFQLTTSKIQGRKVIAEQDGKIEDSELNRRGRKIQLVPEALSICKTN